MKKYWGYDSFRPLQEEIIDSVLQGCDTLVLLPTGGGKSICYQVPALMLDGICIVVSPLISLMKDQVQQLRSKGIKAACLVSGLTSVEQDVVLNNCIHGKTKMLYVSPERLRQRVFIEHLRQMRVSMIAVDEAHCISQWGYDFRPSYLEIAQIRSYCPQAPIMALTATATPIVVDDIRRQLNFSSQSNLFQGSFLRTNLSYMVFKEENKQGRLLRIARNVNGSGIVYVRNRRRTCEVAAMLVSNGISATYYHAGLDPKERDTAQLRWMKGEVRVMVATNAFGMGIDKPDVRFVVHLDLPASIEAYYQEAGRAGRDGAKSHAVVLYDDADLEALQKSFDTSYPTLQRISDIYRAICNYYQLPIGSGTDCQFDFDLESICNAYHLNVLELFSAARFLEREGLLSLPERNDAESSVFIPLNREELYRFQVSQPRYSDLITMILRQYGGLFTEFVPISERLLARRLYLDEQQVTNMLLHLDALKAIVYKCKRKNPQIIFTSPRIEARGLYLSEINYRELKQRAQERLDAIRDYITADKGCRSQMLLSYFGEEQSDRCGTCDLCILEGSKKTSASSSIEERIKAVLCSQPLRAEEVVQQVKDLDERQVVQQLRDMVDHRLVTIDENLRFHLV